jgi:hypothetical protein
MDRGSDVICARPTVSRQGIAFDYNLPAELYLSRRRGRHTDYRRFATAAKAIHYAVVELRTRRSRPGATSSDYELARACAAKLIEAKAASQ